MDIIIERNSLDVVGTGDLKVFIVDDSPIIRDHLKERLAEFEKISLIGEAENIRMASEALDSLAPDVIILDIRLPDGSGMSILNDLQKKEPAPHVIIYTSFAYPQYRETYMRAGAHYFFDKNLDTEALIDTIKNLGEKISAGSDAPPLPSTRLDTTPPVDQHEEE